jgi:hypothetical protein
VSILAAGRGVASGKFRSKTLRRGANQRLITADTVQGTLNRRGPNDSLIWGRSAKGQMGKAGPYVDRERIDEGHPDVIELDANHHTVGFGHVGVS